MPQQAWGSHEGGPPTPPPPPPCIDDFDVGQELGRGGFAVVYRARARVSGLEVALKVVDKQRASVHLTNANATRTNSSNNGNAGGGAAGSTAAGLMSGAELACARVANEVRLHWGLKHPTVVELLEFFEDERFVYMVLELCGGGDLYRRLRERGPLGEAEAAGYMGQLLAGLAYLHERGVMHRDLKLSNLLLSQDGRRLRIGDFGLAVKLDDEDHERHTICGTPNYMAPEVQGPGYGLSADLWSAGCLFYAMVTGGAPFQGSRVGDTLANAREGRYVEPEGLSASAKDFLACMLSLDPTRRMRVEQAAAHPFLRLDKERPEGLIKKKPTVATPNKTGIDKGTAKGGVKVSSDGRRKKLGSHGYSARPFCGKSKGGSRSSLFSPGGGASASAFSGSGIGGAAGHNSTLTASTAVLGSDLCSLDSSILEGGDAVSFSTLQADTVPTPATIGEGAVAAAARVRRAAARAPFQGSVEGVAVRAAAGRDGVCHGGGEDARAASLRRATRPAAGQERQTRVGHGGSLGRGAGKELGVLEGVRGGEVRERFLGRAPADATAIAGTRRRDSHALRAVNTSVLGESSSKAHGRAGSEPGRSEGRGKDRTNAGVSRSHEARDGWDLAGGNPGKGVAYANNNERFTDDSESSDRYASARFLQLRQQQQYQQQRRRRRRRPRRAQSQSSSSSSSPSSSSHKQRHAVSVHDAGFARARELRHREAVGDEGACSTDESVPAPCSGAVAAASSPFRRRRQREPGRPAARPPPPLPPQPPPFSDDGRSASSLDEMRELRGMVTAQRQLHEKLYASSGAGLPTSTTTGSSSRTGEGIDDVLVPFSTARVKPLSHRSGGRAAVEVLTDGRASITVGKRWLLASGNGKRVWTGVLGMGRCSSSEGSVSIAGGGRAGAEIGTIANTACLAAVAAATASAETADAGYSLHSLPKALHPLYKSLAGIVNALRSKTPKVVLRFERTGGGARVGSTATAAAATAAAATPCAGVDGLEKRTARDSAQPAELILCSLMDNLPDPDFAAAFDDGTSLSLWTRKNELRVELPCGSVRSWSVGPRSKWPGVVCDGAGAGGDEDCESCAGWGALSGRESRNVKKSENLEDWYLQEGFGGYCRCLSEEAAAYRRGAIFPVETVVKVVSAPVLLQPAVASPQGSCGREAYQRRLLSSTSANSSVSVKAATACVNNDAGDIGHWWRGDDDDSTSSESESSMAVELVGENNGHTRRGSDDGDSGGDKWGSTSRGTRHGYERRRGNGEARRKETFAGVNPDLTFVCAKGGGRPTSMSDAASPEHSPPATTVEDSLDHSGCDHDVVARQAGQVLHCRYEKFVKVPSLDTCSLTCSPTSEDCTVHVAGRRTVGRGGAGSGDGNKGGRGKSGEQAGQPKIAAAVIPGLGQAFRDARGDLEVRFSDGVTVVVNAEAKWMRVEQPLLLDRQGSQDPTHAAAPGTERTQLAVTYDLGKNATGPGQTVAGAAGSGGGGRYRGRMPRDVKERMKALPRFIAILKGVPSARKARASSEAAVGGGDRGARIGVG